MFAVYRYLLRKYDPSEKEGSWTQEDSEELRKLIQVHGKNWKKIGTFLGRSATSVKDHARFVLKERRLGKWSDEDTDKLCRIVSELGSPQTIPWRQVSVSDGDEIFSLINQILLATNGKPYRAAVQR